MKKECPEEVPILEAKDFCKGSLRVEDLPYWMAAKYADGSHCLLGWTETVFKGQECRDRVFAALVDEIISRTRGNERKKHRCKTEYVQPALYIVPEFNDRDRRPLSTLAAVWNAAMAKLGYTQQYIKAGKVYKRID